MQANYSIPTETLIANRAARNFGSNRATEIKRATRGARPLKKEVESGKVSMRCLPRVSHYDGYHAESRTGIRASMAALKRFWSTYHYVAAVCVVIIPDIDAIYSNDQH